MDVKAAIQTGNATALRRLLAEDPARANHLIEWGKGCEIHTHPLHYVSDMLFEGVLPRGREIPLIEALLEAGADYNHQAPNGETPLIGAASLGAVDVGLALIDAGARTDAAGAFQETALHWAAHLGLRPLVARLIGKGADVNRKDARYNSSPVGWAVHGRYHSPAAGHAEHPQVVELLVAAGAAVEPGWLVDEQVRVDPRMLSALQSGRR